MIPKIKRVKLKNRKKFAAGDEARKFENIPTASQPQQQTIGTQGEYIDKYVAQQVASPELATAAKQTYTTQAVQADELMKGATLAAPTDVTGVSISKDAIAAPTAGVSTAAAAPGALAQVVQGTAATVLVKQLHYLLIFKLQ